MSMLVTSDNELNYQYAALEYLMPLHQSAQSQARTTMEYLEDKYIHDVDHANDLFDQVADMIGELGDTLDDYSKPELFEMVRLLNQPEVVA